MTVKEFLQSLDQNELILSFMNYEEFYDKLRRDYPNEPIENLLALTLKAQKGLKKFLDELLAIEPAPNKNGDIIFSIKGDEGKMLDSFMVFRRDVESLNAEYEHYAYEFESWDNVLGWDISEACRYAVGDYPYACSILYELSFFGYDRETQEGGAGEILKSVKDSIQTIEEQKPQMKSWEEIAEDLNLVDSRSEAEKAFDSDTIRIEALAHRNYRQEYMRQLFQLENSYKK